MTTQGVRLTGVRNWSRWLPLAILLAPVVLVGSCMARSRWWWAGAESAIATAVRTTAEGRSDPDVEVTLETGTSKGSRWEPREDFRTRYRTTGPDDYLRGTSVLDLLDPAAAAYVAHLEFANGHIYHAEAVREGGRWYVSLSPAEGQ
jgi:hypothetical protein